MKKFLVIQQKKIGDVTISSLLCEHLKIHFPACEVHYVIHEHTLAVVEGNPYIDKVIEFKHRYRESKWAFYGFLKSMKRETYYAVIDVYCKLESNLISYFSRSAIKISYRKWYSKGIYTHTLPYVKNTDTALGFAIENRLSLLSPLIETLQKPDLTPKIHLTADEIDAAKQLLAQKQIDTSKPVIMVGLLGSQPDKTYPLAYLAESVHYIAQKFEVTFLLNYMPSQKEKVDEFLKGCPKETRNSIRDDVFCPSLRSFMGLLSQCNAYFGNEGGGSNFSKALGIPNFSIFSPWISKRAWFTFSKNSANRAVHLSDFRPEILSQRRKYLRKNTLELYAQLKPALFLKSLVSFIEEEVIPNP